MLAQFPSIFMIVTLSLSDLPNKYLIEAARVQALLRNPILMLNKSTMGKGHLKNKYKFGSQSQDDLYGKLPKFFLVRHCILRA